MSTKSAIDRPDPEFEGIVATRPQESVQRWPEVIDLPLSVLSLMLLSLSIFAAARLSLQYEVTVTGLMAGIFYLNLAPGRTRERMTQRAMMLFLVILTDVYLISFAHNDHTGILWGATATQATTILTTLCFGLWVLRAVSRWSLATDAPILDLAIGILCGLSLIAYLRFLFLTHNTGATLEPARHLTWVVVVSSIIYRIVADVGRPPSKRAVLLRLAPLPLMISCGLAILIGLSGVHAR